MMPLAQATTLGVQVTVEHHYDARYSDPRKDQYFYAYHLEILNRNHFAIKVVERHWRILECERGWRDLIRTDFLGERPILHHGRYYQFHSGMELYSELGRMWGTLLVQNLDDHSRFEVQIPSFQLLFPDKSN